MGDSEILHASFKEWILQDWQANAGRTDARFVVVAFRIAQFLCRRYPLLYDLYKVPYWLILSAVLGIELPAQITIGKRLQIWHAHAIIINIHAVIGDDCILRHGVTIGNQGSGDEDNPGVPRLGNGVNLGCGCAVLGDIDLADNVTVGALTVVTKSVPAGKVIVGSPARILN
jgi:putative colanic acid biosynthesis acetyltransferase WcaB